MDFSDCDRRLQQTAMDAMYGGQKQLLRKINKPLVEKKRRARINTSLQQLKSLVVTALSKTNSTKAKLEKADILEMTVKYIRNLQRQQYANSAAADPAILNKYRAGFMACIREVSGLLTSMDGLDLDTKARVLDHLAAAMTASVSPQAKSSTLVMSSSDSDDSPVKESPLARKKLYNGNDVTGSMTGSRDIITCAMMDSGLGSELDSTALTDDDDDDTDEDSVQNSCENETPIMSSVRPSQVGAVGRPQQERTFHDYNRQNLDLNNNQEGLPNANSNNLSLPSFTQVFRRSHDQSSANQIPTTSQTVRGREFQNYSSNVNFQKPQNPQILRVRCGNIQQFPNQNENSKFGKMYNALTKPMFSKPYKKVEKQSNGCMSMNQENFQGRREGHVYYDQYCQDVHRLEAQTPRQSSQCTPLMGGARNPVGVAQRVVGGAQSGPGGAWHQPQGQDRPVDDDVNVWRPW